jgi:hypothetical protein
LLSVQAKYKSYAADYYQATNDTKRLALAKFYSVFLRTSRTVTFFTGLPFSFFPHNTVSRSARWMVSVSPRISMKYYYLCAGKKHSRKAWLSQPPCDFNFL